ncbi:MAG: signal peptidase II [Elusimicrobiota bacterium]
MCKKSIIIIIIVLILDQLTKFIIIKKFYLGESVAVLKNIFHITYITNTGAAFGIFQGYGKVLLIFSIVAIILISVLIFTRKNIFHISQVSFSLILGGAIGNLSDRIFRGEIVDFLDFRIWPVFNIADSAITVGMTILFIYSFLPRSKEKDSNII